MSIERVEIARMKSTEYHSTADVERFRQVIRAVRLCRRIVEVEYDGTSIIFKAAWRKTGTHKKASR